MANLQGQQRARYVQEMFARIAGRYDLMNRVMTAGQDRRWRKEVIRRAHLSPDGLLLDLGAGTGDLAREALRQHPAGRALAADFTIQMMQAGRMGAPNETNQAHRLDWSAADAQQLPLPDGLFDAVVSGFLLRNVSDLDACLREQYRVLKPGGRIVSLDTSPPPNTPLAPLMRFHLHTVIPAAGRLLTGQKDAYLYLPDSTEGFLTPEALAERLSQAGFQEVSFKRLMFGAIAIHWGHK